MTRKEKMLADLKKATAKLSEAHKTLTRANMLYYKKEIYGYELAFIKKKYEEAVLDYNIMQASTVQYRLKIWQRRKIQEAKKTYKPQTKRDFR